MADLSKPLFSTAINTGQMSPVGGGGGGGGAGGFLGSLGSLFTAGNPVMAGLQALGGLFGGGSGVSQKNLDRARGDVMGLAGHQGPIGFNTGMGFAGPGGFAFNPTMQQQMGGLSGASQLLMGGGLFGDQNFQNAFANNDMAGALGQANSAWGQQMGNSAFGNMGGMMNNAGGLQQMLQGMALGGPQDMSGGQQAAMFGMGMGNQQAGLQDLSGGMMGGLFGQGMANQMNAGNQGALQSQELQAMRSAAQPMQDRMFNKMQDRLFAQGRLGSTGGAQDMEGFFNAVNQQDLGFQNESFGRGMQQAQFMGQLGGQQMGQGAGFLGQNMQHQNMRQQLGMQQSGLGANMMGQNLGQFNQNVQGAQGLLGLMGGLEGQGFQQMLQGLQQNQSAGQQRLGAAMGLFGQGADTFASQFGLGLGAQDSLMGMGNFGLQAGRSPWELQAGLLSGSGQHADALAQIGTTKVSGGGFMSGLFSDERLKDNLHKIGTVGDLNWYAWDWNELAHEVGASQQPSYGFVAQEVEQIMPEAVFTMKGFKAVNYEMVLGAGV